MGKGQWPQCETLPVESEVPKSSCYASILTTDELIVTLLPEPLLDGSNCVEGGFLVQIYVCSIKAIAAPIDDVTALAAAIGGELPSVLAVLAMLGYQLLEQPTDCPHQVSIT